MSRPHPTSSLSYFIFAMFDAIDSYVKSVHLYQPKLEPFFKNQNISSICGGTPQYWYSTALAGREFYQPTLTLLFSLTSTYLRHADNWVHVDVTRSFAPQFTCCRPKPAIFKFRIMCIVSERRLRLPFHHPMDTAPACQRTTDVFLIQRLFLTRPHK